MPTHPLPALTLMGSLSGTHSCRIIHFASKSLIWMPNDNTSLFLWKLRTPYFFEYSIRRVFCLSRTAFYASYTFLCVWCVLYFEDILYFGEVWEILMFFIILRELSFFQNISCNSELFMFFIIFENHLFFKTQVAT